jgi:hypothetical protein
MAGVNGAGALACRAEETRLLVPEEAAPIRGSKRRRDATSYVVMRRPRPLIVGRASQADLDAEAFARFVGSWGNFSAHVGDRWEQLAGQWAASHIGQAVGADTAYMLEHVEALDENADLHREVERVGVSCPDALFCGRDAMGNVLVQPVDYKVSLDTAGFDQVEAERILDLLTRGGDYTVAAIGQAVTRVGGTPLPPEDGLRAALLERLEAGGIRPVDGCFLSPDTAFNRVHLRSRENQRRQRPLRPADVLLVACSPDEFLSPLPGWTEAQLLLQADRVRADLPGDLGMAERYARLGCGVVGALQTIHSALFGPPVALDSAKELTRLLASHATSLAVLAVLQERRGQRLELLRRRDRLLHFPFRMPALLEALGPAPAGEPEALWPAGLLRDGITALHAAHRDRITTVGERMLGQQQDDTLVLEALEGDWPVFKRAARADLERWAAETRARC